MRSPESQCASGSVSGSEHEDALEEGGEAARDSASPSRSRCRCPACALNVELSGIFWTISSTWDELLLINLYVMQAGNGIIATIGLHPAAVGEVGLCMMMIIMMTNA